MEIKATFENEARNRDTTKLSERGKENFQVYISFVK